MTLGETLKKARERKNMSLRDVEKILKDKEVNYTYTNIKRIEDEDSQKVPIKVLSALSEIYSLDKINVLNLAGANIEEEDELNNFVKKGALFFNNQKISEDDKKKVLETLTEMFYESRYNK